MAELFWDFGQIAEQRDLSQQVLDLASEAVRCCYCLNSVGWDIGSYARGTNVDDIVDIDALFLGIPHDAQRGYYDWTDYDTYGLHAANELTDLESVCKVDPVLGQTIGALMQRLATIAASPVFRWVHSGRDSPDVYFRIEASHLSVGLMVLDVTLAHAEENFGLEHAHRFERYLQQVAQTSGQDRALRLLGDIRQLKRLVKALTTMEGIVDKRAKVPGFGIEALVTSGHEPRTFVEVVAALRSLASTREDSADLAHLPEYIVNQTIQLVDTGLAVGDIARYVTQGGYRTLAHIGSASARVS